MVKLSIPPLEVQETSQTFVCAWCRQSTCATNPKPHREINFGICPDCLTEQIARLEARESVRRPATVVRPGNSQKQLANGSGH